jgi:hypothetical protein
MSFGKGMFVWTQPVTELKEFDVSVETEPDNRVSIQLTLSMNDV